MLRVDDLDEQARELNWSGFLSMRGGMAFGGLAYLLVAGLLVVYYGATQGDDGTGTDPVIVAAGWLLVVSATLGNTVMLRRFLRFWGAVRAWVRLQVQRNPQDAKHTRLEAKITRSGRGRQFGPAAEFAAGALLLAPCGLAMTYLALLFQVIGVVDTVSSDGAPALDWAFMLIALVPSLLAVTLGTLVLVGLSTVGTPVSKWRR